MDLKKYTEMALEAGKQQQEQEQQKGVEQEIKTYEESQEQIAAKQQRLEQISARKQEDEQKIAEIRTQLKGSTGFNKVKNQINQIGKETGLEETKTNEFIQQARDKRRTIVEGKLSQRKERQQIREGINELDNEATSLQDEIANIEQPTLSREAKAEFNKRKLEQAQQTFDQTRQEALASLQKVVHEWDDKLEKYHPLADEAVKNAENEARQKGLSDYGINRAKDDARSKIMAPVYKQRDQEVIAAKREMQQTIDDAENILRKVRSETRG